MPAAGNSDLLRPEALPVLGGSQETINQIAVVIRLVQGLNPIQVEAVRIASQVAEVLHDDECLVVELD